MDSPGREAVRTAPSRRHSLSTLGTSVLSACNSISTALSTYCEPQVSYPTPRGSPKKIVESASEQTPPQPVPSCGSPRRRRWNSVDQSACPSTALPVMRHRHFVTGGPSFDLPDYPDLVSFRLTSSPTSVASDLTSSHEESCDTVEPDAPQPAERGRIATRRPTLQASPSLMLSPPSRELSFGQRRTSQPWSHRPTRPNRLQPALRLDTSTGIPTLVSASSQHLSPHGTASSPVWSARSSRSSSPCPSLESIGGTTTPSTSAARTPSLFTTEDDPFDRLSRSSSISSFRPLPSPLSGGGGPPASPRKARYRSMPPLPALPPNANAKPSFIGDLGIYLDEDANAESDEAFFAHDDVVEEAEEEEAEADPPSPSKAGDAAEQRTPRDAAARRAKAGWLSWAVPAWMSWSPTKDPHRA